MNAAPPITTSDFDYELPSELIAQAPPTQRDGGRLLCLPRREGGPTHRRILELPDLIPTGALLVVNDSRVIPARLAARRPTGGKVEVMLLEALVAPRWRAMLRSSKGPKLGETLELLDARGEVAGPLEIVTEPAAGRCEVALDAALIARCGAMPLPPYIRRPADAADAERYQTVYARAEGSVAAPTAGLHFTPTLLAALEERGIERAAVTLHVGPGTFVPVRVDDPNDHQMEEERYDVSEVTAEAIAAAKAEGRPVLAVGTTAVRTLESSAGQAGVGRTSLFIRPGYRFQVVDALLTNFHLPCSTLLMLVSAFAGRERVLAAYREAVAQRYRFYSYGDAMLLS